MHFKLKYRSNIAIIVYFYTIVFHCFKFGCHAVQGIFKLLTAVIIDCSCMSSEILNIAHSLYHY